jgi:hypothetical protein
MRTFARGRSVCKNYALALIVVCFTGAIGLSSMAWSAEAGSESRLAFDINDGINVNSFLRAGPVSAHLILRSGVDPRILVAFPAGDSGVGLWFEHVANSVVWTLLGRPRPITVLDGKGRALYGIVAEVSASGGATLAIKQAALSSVRVLRDYQDGVAVPAIFVVSPAVYEQTISWARDRFDGAPGYQLIVEVTDGELKADRIYAGGDGKIGLHITAVTGETPLTPLGVHELLNDRAAAAGAALNALSFLSYREKLLAGSWHYDTYFGRDTLMSLRLLMPVLSVDAMQAGLGAVLSRLSPGGEVAHEEDIGEYAVLDHLKAGEASSDRPVFDYDMIDSSYMLAPVIASWLLDDNHGRNGAAAFLARADGRHGGTPRVFGTDLVQNLRLVVRSAVSFANSPLTSHLISLKEGNVAGQWRDSAEGIGRGRYPYDVNVVFVPAALEAAARLYANGLLNPYLSDTDRALFSRAAGISRVWREKARPLFAVSIANVTARRDVADYAASLGISADAPLMSIGRDAVQFHAISLDQQGRPVPIVHTDEGFDLLFGRPNPAVLKQEVAAVMRPFPAGLLTDVGIVVANPVFAGADVQARTTRFSYHGEVIWSWQQAVLAAGFERQLHREDLSSSLRQRLRAAQDKLWQVIHASSSEQNSELWSWCYRNGRFEVATYAEGSVNDDESDAVQLWSTVFLAIPAPDSY